jgi:hypothetical protein
MRSTLMTCSPFLGASRQLHCQQQRHLVATAALRVIAAPYVSFRIARFICACSPGCQVPWPLSCWLRGCCSLRIHAQTLLVASCQLQLLNQQRHSIAGCVTAAPCALLEKQSSCPGSPG